MRKTDADLHREAVAHEINSRLIGTGVSVVGGGSDGPYTVIVNRLSQEDAVRVVAAVLRETRDGWAAALRDWDRELTRAAEAATSRTTKPGENDHA